MRARVWRWRAAWVTAAACALLGLPRVAPPPALAAGATVPAAPAPSLPAAQTKAAGPLASLVGQVFALCSWAGVPFEALVEQAAWEPGPAGQMQAVLVVRVAHDGGGATGAYVTVRLRDERGRVFDFARAGSGVDVMDLARAYSVLTPTMPVQAGRPARHLWAFVVAPDARALTLDQDPAYRCA